MKHYHYIKNNRKFEFINNNFACFAELTNKKTFEIIKEKWVHHTYISESELSKYFDKKSVYYFIKELQKLNCPVKIKSVKKPPEQCNTAWKISFKEGFVISIDLFKCESVGYFIFMLHLLRYAWNENGPLRIKNAHEYMKKHKCSFWEAFFIVTKYINPGFTDHEYILDFVIVDLQKLKNIQQIFDDFKMNHYNSGSKIRDFLNSLNSKKSFYRSDIKTTIEQYKNDYNNCP